MDFGGGFATKDTSDFGSVQNIGLMGFVLVIVLLFSCMCNPFLRMSGIAAGLAAVY